MHTLFKVGLRDSVQTKPIVQVDEQPGLDAIATEKRYGFERRPPSRIFTGQWLNHPG